MKNQAITTSNVKNFVKTISKARNGQQVIVAYLSAEITTPDDLQRFNYHVL